MERDGLVKQSQHFRHHGDTICHPKSGYVTAKLHGTSTCRRNNKAIFSDRAIFKLIAVYVCRNVNLAAAKPWLFTSNWKHGSTVEFIIFRV